MRKWFMRLVIVLFVLAGAPQLARANQSFYGWCEAGATSIVTAGLTSTNYAQGSFPSCTVTVNVHGGGLATLYSDNGSPPTPLANPFTAGTNGYYEAYAVNGRYDITLSGGGLPSPVTYSDVLLNDSGLLVGSFVVVPFSTTPVFIASVATVQQITLTGNVTSSSITNATQGQFLAIEVCQDSVGGHTFTWPSNVLSAPTISGTPDTCTMGLLLYDGTNWYGVSGSGGGSGLFSSFQIQSNPAITTPGNYIQFLAGTNVTLGQTGAGTALSPYLVTITASTTAATAWSAITPGTNTNASGGNGFILTQGDTGTTPWTINCLASQTVPCLEANVGTSSALYVGPLGYVNAGIGLNVYGPAAFEIATGTPPFTVTSTTNVPNLNASSLNGFTFAAPGTIGGTTPGAATFTAVTDTALVSGAASNVCATTAGVLYVTGCSGTQAWSSLATPTANLSLNLANFNSIFYSSPSSGSNPSSFYYENLTAATSSQNQYGVLFQFAQNYWTGSVSNEQTWNLQPSFSGSPIVAVYDFSSSISPAAVEVPNLIIDSITGTPNCLQTVTISGKTFIGTTAGIACNAENVNGSTINSIVNFNGTTPAAGSGFVNGTFQVSGNNVSVEVPTGSTPSVGGTCAVQFASGSSFQGDATNFCYTTSTHALAITGQLTAASLVLTSQNSFTLGNGSQTNASFYQADSGSGTSNTTPAYLALGASPADTYFSYLYPCSSAGNWCASSSTPSADSSRTIAFHGGYNPQSGTTYTIANTDEDGLTNFTSSSSVAVTLPCPSGTSFVQGWPDTLVQGGSGAVTVTTSGCNILVNGTAGTSLTVPTTGVKITSTGSATGTAFVASFNGSGSGSGVSSLTCDGVVETCSPTTGAVTLVLGTAGAYKFLMNNTASPATPTYATATLASAQFADQGTTSQVLIGNASGNPSWGTLPCGAMPTFTGDVSNSSCAMTVVQVGGGAIPASATVVATNSSKQLIAAPLASADIWVGNSSNLPVAVTPSGDWTMTNAGVDTVGSVHGVSYPASPSTTTVPVVTASNTVTYENLSINYLGNPNASHAFTMGNDTLTFNFGAALTSTGIEATDTSSDTGTNGLFGAITAASSANIAAIFEATAASNGTFTNPLALLLGNATAATSSQNQPSPEFAICGNAWEESTPASEQDCGVFQYTFASGSNPTATLALTRSTPGTNSIIQLLVSGVVDGKAPVTPITSSTFTFGTTGGSYLSGYYDNINSTTTTAVTGTLPTAAAGIQYCIDNSNNGTSPDTGALTIQTSASGQYIEFTDGTYSASDGYVVSGGAARDSACVRGIDSSHWMLYVYSGTWTKH